MLSLVSKWCFIRVQSSELMKARTIIYRNGWYFSEFYHRNFSRVRLGQSGRKWIFSCHRSEAVNVTNKVDKVTIEKANKSINWSKQRFENLSNASKVVWCFDSLCLINQPKNFKHSYKCSDWSKFLPMTLEFAVRNVCFGNKCEFLKKLTSL